MISVFHFRKIWQHISLRLYGVMMQSATPWDGGLSAILDSLAVNLSCEFQDIFSP